MQLWPDLWAVLIARIYEVFALLCPVCGGQMRIIAFITHIADIRQILEHIGVDSEPPHITPARGPLMLKTKTKTVSARALPEGIEVTFAVAEEGVTVPAPQVYDLVLQAVGRTPNGKKIAADKAGVAVTDRGFINVDIQMRTNVPHIFAIGDVVGQPMLAHKAVHEAHVAIEVIAGELLGNKELAAAAFYALVIPCVAYTNLEVAWVGLTEDSGQGAGHQGQSKAKL